MIKEGFCWGKIKVYYIETEIISSYNIDIMKLNS